MVIAMLPGTALAFSYNAAEIIGGTQYATLQAAVGAVTEGQTIKLLNNVTGKISIPYESTLSFTLDLNGCTMESTSGHTIEHKGTGALTITDTSESTNGKILNEQDYQYHVIYISNTGTVNLVNGIVEKNTTSSSGSAVRISSSGHLNISGGKVISTVIAVASDSGSASADITVSGGEITSSGSNSCVYLSSNYEFTLSGGVITHTNDSGFAINQTSKTFLSTFDVNLLPGKSATISSSKQAMNVAPTNISGSPTSTASANVDGTDAASYNEASIDSYKYLKFVFADVAQIGSTGYSTLQDAVNAVGAGQTIQLIRGITLSDTVTIANGNTKSFTLDLYGQTLNGCSKSAINHQGSGTLTIADSGTGGEIKNNSETFTIGAVLNEGTGRVIISGGTVQGNYTGICNRGTGTVVVSGGTVSANTTGVFNNGSGFVIVSGGTVKSTGASGRAIYTNEGGNITISDDAIVTSNDTGSSTIHLWFSNNSKPIELTIKGGTIENTAGGNAISRGGDTAAVLTANISIPNGKSATVKGGLRAMTFAPTLTKSIVKVAATNVDGVTGIASYNPEDISTYRYLRFEPAPVTIPGAPTIGIATAGNGQATIRFAAPDSDGGAEITSYTVTSSPGGIIGTGASSPVTLTGLTNGTAYTFTVTATNSKGTGAASAASNSVTPQPQEATPSAAFTAIGADTGALSNVTAAMKYSVDGGINWLDITGVTMNLIGVSAANGVKVYKAGNGTTTANSAVQSITVTKASAPTTVDKIDCTTLSNNDGKLIGVTNAMEYKYSTTDSWIDGTGNEITSLANGIYYVRVKATGAVLASDNQTITINAYSAPPSGDGSGGSSTPATVTKIESGGNVTGTNVDNLVKQGKSLTVEGKAGERLVFDTEALKTIDGQTKDSVKVEIKDVSADHKTEHPDRLVVSLTITAGGKHITSFGNGTATVSLPYELKAGEKAEDVTVWYLAEDGKMTEVPCTYDPSTKLATFKVNHFSLYVVGTADTGAWTNPYSDVKESSWYYDAVRYVSANELMNGTTDTAFNPGAKTTRGMIVTILWRMENEPKVSTGMTFADVKSGKYYYDAIAWACEKGIVSGYSAEQFAPEDSITREQLAVILYNYAASKGYNMVVSGTPSRDASGDLPANLSAFSDAGMIHKWGKEALSWANTEGLINGTGSNFLNPLGDAQRSQVAAILQRFIENTAE
ncbi:MAG: S-layer homology domain-containing protein [Eubacteriales bacterium]|nr:S-layer homology domain-containing protein [Eubacteriales bacterium]